jgi:DHA1 family tetracycline resistance protein-like MFS transporter
MTDITDEDGRARGLGLLGAAFGLGFVFGPAAGGFLSQWGYYVPALVAAGLSALNWLGVLAFLPESLTGDQIAANAKRSDEQTGFNFGALRDAMRLPVVGTLLTTIFFFRLAFSLLTTIFSLYALKRFDLEAQMTGYLLTYSGVILVIVQGAAIGPLTRRYGENRLIFFSIVLMVFASLGWAFAPNVAVVVIALTPLSIAGGILSTALRSAITRAVDPDEVGGILGIQTALESATRVIAPTLGGFLIGSLGTSAPGLFSAVVFVGLTWFAWGKLLRPGTAE